MMRSLDRVIYYGLQPLLMVGVLTFWYFNQSLPSAYILIVLAVQLILGVTEHLRPARPEWVQRWPEKSRNVIIVVLILLGSIWVIEFYNTNLTTPLKAMREASGLDIWPHHWPVFYQLFLAFFVKEFVWYWMHRAQHRWRLVWRTSGHGAHHAFKNLGAINFGANHPLELFFLAIPGVLLEVLFGVGVAAAGSVILLTTQASIAHSNIRMNSKLVGWLFTTNRYHIHHHSAILEESNTNYGCAALIWDRIFGTFADAETIETGTGPTEPTTWQKLVMPMHELDDTAIAPG